VDPLSKLDKASAVHEIADRLVAYVYSAKLQPRVATGLASLLSLQLRAIEATNLEQRIDKIERLLSKAEKAQPGQMQPHLSLSNEPRAQGDSAPDALARKHRAFEEFPWRDDASSRKA
jgi:hypothetical protein